MTARWVFECTECGERWVDPDAPVTGHYCNRHPRANGLPEGEPADVVAVETPDGDSE